MSAQTTADASEATRTREFLAQSDAESAAHQSKIRPSLRPTPSSTAICMRRSTVEHDTPKSNAASKTECWRGFWAVIAREHVHACWREARMHRAEP